MPDRMDYYNEFAKKIDKEMKEDLMKTTNKQGLSMLKINKLFPIKYRFTKKFSLWKYNIRIEERSKDNLWGRFGGGWDWKLGIQIGGSTIIISLLIGEIIINKKKER